MRCTSPRTVGFYPDGKTLCWSPKKYSKEFAPFQIPCGKCISCRLENARQTAVRCVHEAQMHPENSFITLTYNEASLKSAKLQYKDFQTFQKALRTFIFDEKLKERFPDVKTQSERRQLYRDTPKDSRDALYEKTRTAIYVAGEYGDIGKRPHWHALIFNWRPQDLVPKYTSDRGDQVFTSPTLSRLWPHGNSELGSVTFESAGYCARYASKKLQHGKDGEHDFNPISRRSSRNAIGKKWIEKYWPDVFRHGYVEVNGQKTSVPRYYEKWFKKNHPDKWVHYVTQIKSKIIQEAIEKEKTISLEEKKINMKRSGLRGLQIKRARAREKIMKQKHDSLQKHLKL